MIGLKNRKKNLTMLIGLLIGGAALGLFILRLDSDQWGELWDSVRLFTPTQLPFLFLFIALMYICRIWRWEILLSTFEKIKLLRIINSMFIGLLANNVLPARAGEFIRPYYVQKGCSLGFADSLASVMLDRFFDLIGMMILVLFTGIMLIINRERYEAVTSLIELNYVISILVVVIFLVTLLFFLFFLIFPLKIGHCGERILALFPDCIHRNGLKLINALVMSARRLQVPKKTLSLVILSAFAWISQGVSLYFIASGLGIDVGLGGAFLATVAVCFAIALPQAPGYIGTYHLAIALAAELTGASVAQAGAFAILAWAFNILPVSLLGFVALLYETFRTRRKETG